jgi:hypothetical protein
LLIGILPKIPECFFDAAVKLKQRFVRGSPVGIRQFSIRFKDGLSTDPQSREDDIAYPKFNIFQILLQVLGVLGPLSCEGKKIEHGKRSKSADRLQHPLPMGDAIHIRQQPGFFETTLCQESEFSCTGLGNVECLFDMSCNKGVLQRLKPDVTAAGDDRGEKHLGFGNGQEENVLSRRFFENFQESICRLVSEILGISNGYDTVSPLEWTVAASLLKAVDLVQFDEGAFAEDVYVVGMVAFIRLPARRADIATIEVLNIQTIQCLGKLPRQSGFAAAGETAEEKGVGDPSSPYDLSKEAFCPGLARDPTHGHEGTHR